MDPSRIRLEDDRFGLIGAAFRPGNRAVYAGRRGGDHVWSIGIIVGPEDDIQTVEIDDHGAKSSRMLTSGELFEGLDILAAPGTEAFIIAGTFTLMGMELSAINSETTSEFAEILRAAADDHSWRLPLRVVGHPRDLQLSAQGRDILRETAATLERDGSATTSLAAARRLELSEQALDSIRRRISRASLQAYRMHGRWYVVLDNLARSRTTPPAVEEAPEEAEEPAAAEVATEPVTAEPEVTEPEVLSAEASEPEQATEPSVEYVEVQPAEEVETPVAAAEAAAPETAEVEFEATAPDVEEAAEPKIEEAADIEELAAEPIREEATEAEAEFEESPAAEPVAEAEYRAAATSPAPTSPIDEDFATAGAEMTEQATEASIEELAAETAVDEGEAVETPTLESEQFIEGEPEAEAEPSAEVEVEPAVEPEPHVEAEVEFEEAIAPEPESHAPETAAGIDEPVVAEDMAAIEEMTAEEPAPQAELAAEETVPEAAEEAETLEVEGGPEPEVAAEEPATSALSDESTPPTEEFTPGAPEETAAEPALLEAATVETTFVETVAIVEEQVVEELTTEEPGASEVEPEQAVEPDIAEPVQSEEALLFAEMLEQTAAEEPAATELEADVAEQSDQLIEERIGDVAPVELGEVSPAVSEASIESEMVAGEPAAADEPSDEVIAEGIRTHFPAYADEVGRDELITSSPAPEASGEQVEPEAAEASAEQAEPETAEAPESAGAEAEPSEAEPEQSGGPSAASYFADARGGAGARGATPTPAPAVDFATHLRGEVAFLRQQSREKDRQIGVWGDGAKWLQPFVDQIRSLEKQVERLGELQVQRENERISDLISERDALRQRLEALEAKITATQTAPSAPAESNRRSWFRRMMGSE